MVVETQTEQTKTQEELAAAQERDRKAQEAIAKANARTAAAKAKAQQQNQQTTTQAKTEEPVAKPAPSLLSFLNGAKIFAGILWGLSFWGTWTCVNSLLLGVLDKGGPALIIWTTLGAGVAQGLFTFAQYFFWRRKEKNLAINRRLGLRFIGYLAIACDVMTNTDGGWWILPQVRNWSFIQHLFQAFNINNGVPWEVEGGLRFFGSLIIACIIAALPEFIWHHAE